MPPLPRRLTLSALFLLIFVAAPSTAPAQASLSNEAAAVLERFAAQLAEDVEADSVGGITAAVVFGDQVVWADAFGWADRAQQIPAGTETIYRVGSISKSITAVALVQLAEQGVLSLDDPVEHSFPAITSLDSLPDLASSITFRQLASHTAGLIREPTLPDAASGLIETWEDKILMSIPTTSFKSPPGTEYSYSNIGFGILGLALSRAANKPFMALVHNGIFEPLGMQSSTFILTPEMKEHLAVGYANRGDSVNTAWPAREHAGRGYKVPNGGVYSTVGDLAQFIAGQTGAASNPILSAESRAEMQRVQTPESDTEGYGLGFSIRRSEAGHRIVGHGGSVAGYTAYLCFEPETKIGVILLRNYNSGRTNLGRSASRLLSNLVTTL
ncbi:MAG: serine hydrolase domain-containing protein [Rhodothermales bacterium]